ncbi:UDP-4-amino-4,6-dideoxy-N-acetyl-beta-L-altrosamine transaminase [Paenibacillus thalictri]|uniref:UDP-4-amino-4, 6-dideoxy-N-acetyl-beta-L-altrosamine transaminase n=1 Tax=Paenibacillus thalictri TaxID=2527873 RepID=A0A4Q9DDV4_9BACL|nr:UDP-4-amino-4,6-dideoxy-N-acetyl-beta-L-altrosamine transaminase [Paenibacillus thalictri]TBL67783.1 UDP-4-amino-4,6-dideoxy-N-acetyl-beta-L-altrosamine transaminase [Paenibacillus thalictri]
MKNEGLAINGGKRVRETFLPYGKQWIDDEDIQAVVSILKSEYLTTGPAICEFEEKIAGYVDAKYAVAFANGTAALHAACFAAGIAEGDEVITTPLTFAASANCVLYQGGRPVFVDIDKETYNIDAKKIFSHVNSKTKAIIPVDYTGQPADLDSIIRIAKDNNLVVIEDAAHALGATYKGKRVGSISDMTMFSLHPVKHITTGEGGVITTNDSYYYNKLIQFRAHGITRDPQQLVTENRGSWYYEMQVLGYNYRITDFQAALGSSQLEKLPLFLERRKKNVALYNQLLTEFSEKDKLIIPFQHQDGESSWHLYVIQLRSECLKVDRDTIYKALIKENIGVNVHYIPVYLHPYYSQLGYDRGICPVVEKIYENIITLPLFPLMEESDVYDVVNALQKVLSYYAK